MEKYILKTVNENGIEQIRTFLAENHIICKNGGVDYFTHDNLLAWAEEAEFSLSEGNNAGIELRAFESIHGRTQTFTISDAGLDCEEIELEE